MTLTPLNAAQLRAKTGTKASIIAAEFAKVKTETDALSTANGKAAINIVDLTASMVSSVSLAANGADLASGSNATYYAVWVAPAACTITGVITAMTEAYVKETTDAKIVITDSAGSPVTKFTYTLPTGGRAVKDVVVHTTIASAALAAGDILNLEITATASSTGTGHAKVFLRYTFD